jgi:hypothetical protein
MADRAQSIKAKGMKTTIIAKQNERNSKNDVTMKASHFLLIRKYRGGINIAARYII